ncbi:hypothetical protein [Hymenobacter pini]|uniref:hypothetical protein n=1 Tax=Hymenobacter pini TaxID=2880879 RepID=UPI001CF2B8F7|nr:hypothetical protein [Hymenobacter pini]MCA8829735.1 hypothetical protein [Hymenobacter pini]
MTIPYRPLYLLEAESASIFEIKRLDVQSANPGDVYFWLYFDRASGQLSPLGFVAMNAEGEEHQREFTQGTLHFTATQGTFIPTHTGQPLTLRNITPPVLPTELETALFTFFGQTPHPA